MAIRADDVDLARDAALVRRFQAGDDAAFDELYRRYFHRLCRFCERRVGDPGVAEEIAQDAFARALQALPAFQGDRRFYPWMTVIAHNLCVDQHRFRARVEARAEVDDGTEAAPADDGVLRAVDLVHLDEALQRVRSRHRQILRLREVEGLAYEDIATRMGVPLTTVHALLHRARAALRREFMSIAGTERLVALPLVGLAGRAWQRLRGRIAAWTSMPGSEAFSAVAGPLAAVAALGTAGIIGPVHHPTVTPRPAPVAETTALAPGGEGVDDRSKPAQARVRSQPSQPPPQPPSPEEEEEAQTAPIDVGLGREGSRKAREQAEEMPVGLTVGPVFVGVDPDEVARDLAQALNGGQP